jgi:hypothetical protein
VSFLIEWSGRGPEAVRSFYRENYLSRCECAIVDSGVGEPENLEDER